MEHQTLPIKTSFLVVALLCFFVFNSCSKSQSLPPTKYDGFLYANHPVDSDTIVIEAFFDPVCPDSKDAWPPLKQALQHYAPHVSLVVHLLLLPITRAACEERARLREWPIITPLDCNPKKQSRNTRNGVHIRVGR
ncbi:Thioredoxin-like fold domain-containing protein [Citrus sinensis]|uniref:Thioredoxin-like fold domain-containing protein n=1 Tax=Citrus clementina TaxID=85681 RepID=V4SHW1_CITCL|nr:hypothetical protein CICLE_v10027478mg [Citrus x clementina]KAH9665863.1 Thioredoxin-like fold domain-containing protein [Citrus sinensis]